MKKQFLLTALLASTAFSAQVSAASFAKSLVRISAGSAAAGMACGVIETQRDRAQQRILQRQKNYTPTPLLKTYHLGSCNDSKNLIVDTGILTIVPTYLTIAGFLGGLEPKGTYIKGGIAMMAFFTGNAYYHHLKFHALQTAQVNKRN